MCRNLFKAASGICEDSKLSFALAEDPNIYPHLLLLYMLCFWTENRPSHSCIVCVCSWPALDPIAHTHPLGYSSSNEC